MTKCLLETENDGVQLGFFDRPVGLIDPDRFLVVDPMGRELVGPEKQAQFRQFQFLGAIADDLVVGCALTKTSKIQAAFAYVYQPSSDNFFQIRLPLTKGATLVMAADPDHGVSEFVSDAGSVRMEADGHGTKRLRIDHGDVEIDLSLSEHGFDTLRLCSPAGPTGWAYAQKVAGVPATGTVRSPHGSFDLASIGACAHHDYTGGFLRSETWWNWACVSGRDADGRLIGLNVSCGVNETSFSENCFWVDGVRFPLGGILFEFDRNDFDQPWHVSETGGQTRLTFTPSHGYHASGEAGDIASNFHQLFGNFSGELVASDGTRVLLDRTPGFAETQYIKW